MLSVLVWWFWLQIMGLAALPLAYRLFRRLPDRGYTFARPLGLLLATYVLWLGGSLGLLRNSLGGILFSILVVAVLSLVVYRRGRGPAALAPGSADDPGLLPWLRSQGRLVLAVELLFAAALALWSLLRAYSPELTTAGGEKFMEIMYLNSIGRSEYFPPHDAWLSGYGISYYYFGYVMIAALARLSGFPAHLIFNVGLASLFALTCTGAFGLVYNLVKGTLAPATVQAADDPSTGRTSPLLWGLLGAVLVAVLGNLEGFLEVLYAARLLPLGFWQWLDIEDINLPFDPAVAPSLAPTRSGWWWWRASRVIHDLDPLGNSMGIQPIDEFPGFSFLLGDMHPHVLALPFVLLALALALNALLWGQKEEEDEVSGGSRGWLALLKQPPAGAGLLLVSLCLGALAFLNTWDFPIYWLVFLAAYGLGRWDRYGRSPAAQVNVLRPLARDVAVTGVAVAVLGFLLYLPFYIGFQSQAGGLLPTLYTGTRFRQYFVMFGPFLVAIAGLLAVLAVRLKRGNSGRRLLGSQASYLGYAPGRRWTGSDGHGPASTFRPASTNKARRKNRARGWGSRSRTVWGLVPPSQRALCPALRRRGDAVDPQRRVRLPDRQFPGADEHHIQILLPGLGADGRRQRFCRLLAEPPEKLAALGFPCRFLVARRHGHVLSGVGQCQPGGQLWAYPHPGWHCLPGQQQA
jgi:YYY domain-containing protein